MAFGVDSALLVDAGAARVDSGGSVVVGDVVETGDGGCCCTGAVLDCDCAGGANVGSNWTLTLSRVIYVAADDPGSTCLSFDWSDATAECADGVCGINPSVLDFTGPGGTYMSGGQSFTITWGAGVRSTGANVTELRAQPNITLNGCTGTNLTPTIQTLATGDCDMSGYVGTYELAFSNGWTVYFTLAEGVCP